jgi:hypothetical protein
VTEQLEAAGFKEPNLYMLEHGYCSRSTQPIRTE